jgi:hypothetical protein
MNLENKKLRLFLGLLFVVFGQIKEEKLEVKSIQEYHASLK